MTLNPYSIFRSTVIPFAVIAMTSFSQAATLLTNGDFENWGTGTVPTGWTGNSGGTATQVPGLSGSGSAALLTRTGVIDGAELQQTFAIGAGSTFSLSYDFSQSYTTVADVASARGMNVVLRQSSGTTVLNIAVINGVISTTAGTAFGNASATPFTIAAGAAYRLVVDGSLGVGGRYTLNLFNLADLSTPVYTVTDSTRWQTTPTATTTLTQLGLERGRSAGDWTADNVSLIPEPTSALLLGLGALGFAARRRR